MTVPHVSRPRTTLSGQHECGFQDPCRAGQVRALIALAMTVPLADDIVIISRRPEARAALAGFEAWAADSETAPPPALRLLAEALELIFSTGEITTAHRSLVSAAGQLACQAGGEPARPWWDR